MPVRRALSRILVVDDESAVLKPMLRAFRAAGYPVDSALTAQEARDMVARTAYALVYVDVFLGRDDGEKLAADFGELGLRVILMSGLPLRQLGAEWEPEKTFLAKPIDPNALIAETDRVLGVSGNGTA